MSEDFKVGILICITGLLGCFMMTSCEKHRHIHSPDQPKIITKEK